MITVVLTVWKRNNLAAQIRAVRAQDAPIERIVVYQNESHINVRRIIDRTIEHFHSVNYNHKYHGRFVLPLLFTTPYTVIFDDDTIPGRRWLSHCLSLCEERDCIVGAVGRNHSGQGSTGICDGIFNESPMRCDIVGHCWFFKTHWINYMWRDRAPTFTTGEDIQFCATCKLHGNIDAYVPPQPRSDPDVWGDCKFQLGLDKHASWRKPHHDPNRKELYEVYRAKGWITQ